MPGPWGRSRTGSRGGKGANPPGSWIQAQDVHLFAIREGSVEADFDWVVEWALGGKLDDMRIVGFLVCHMDGRRYGLAFGYNQDGGGRTGAFDFGKDEVLFPTETRFLVMGRTMRAVAEARLADVRGRP